MKNGFFRVAACVPRVTVADPMANARAIAELAREVDALGAELAVFPELSLTGYTCGDLFHNATLLDGCREAMKYLCEATRGLDVCLVAGVPRFAGCRLYNCAVAIHRGEEKCEVAKTYIPNYNEFYERRMFITASAGGDENKTIFSRQATRLFNINGVMVGF